VRDDVVGELGVGGHTVVRGWVWLGAVNQEILANAREVGYSNLLLLLTAIKFTFLAVEPTLEFFSPYVLFIHGIVLN